MARMSHAQMKHLRGLKERGEQPPKRTGDSLVRMGLARKSSEGGYFASPSGVRMVENWVRDTGDGPEDLKAKFRFKAAR